MSRIFAESVREDILHCHSVMAAIDQFLVWLERDGIARDDLVARLKEERHEFDLRLAEINA